jgi:hypothetical protein
MGPVGQAVYDCGTYGLFVAELSLLVTFGAD